MWYVYILECKDGTLYTGATTDVERRFREHKSGTGSKYTKARGVKQLVYSERKRTRSTSQKREAQIKKMSRQQKLYLISGGPTSRYNWVH